VSTYPTLTVLPLSVKRGAKVLGAYHNQRPFSVELVGAVRVMLFDFLGRAAIPLQVQRQGSFIRKIHDLGWTSPSYFEKREDAVALHYALVRYHA
jgi:hypothetical protein